MYVYVFCLYLNPLAYPIDVIGAAFVNHQGSVAHCLHYILHFVGLVAKLPESYFKGIQSIWHTESEALGE